MHAQMTSKGSSSVFVPFCFGSVIWTVRYTVRQKSECRRVHIEERHLFWFSCTICVSLYPLRLSVFSYPPTLPFSLSDTFRASLSSPQSQFGRSSRSWVGEVRGERTLQLCLLTCLVMCQICLRVLLQTEQDDSHSHIWVSLPLHGTIWTLTKLSVCVQDS